MSTGSSSGRSLIIGIVGRWMITSVTCHTTVCLSLAVLTPGTMLQSSRPGSQALCMPLTAPDEHIWHSSSIAFCSQLASSLTGTGPRILSRSGRPALPSRTAGKHCELQLQQAAVVGLAIYVVTKHLCFVQPIIQREQTPRQELQLISVQQTTWRACQ